MTNQRMLTPAVLLAIALIITSCSSSDGTTRSTVVDGVATDVVLPAYEDLVIETGDLSTSVSEFCGNPTDSTLATALEGLGKTEAAWHRTAVVRTGPTEWRRTTNAFPVKADSERIEELINNKEVAVLDADYVGSNTATTQRGLGAVRYLLEGSSTTVPDAAAIDDLGSARRCEYLTASAEAMQTEATELEAEWTKSWNNGAPYIEIFAQSDAEKTIDALVNDSIFVLEELHTIRLQALLDEDASPEYNGTAGDIAFENRFESVKLTLLGPSQDSGISKLVSSALSQRLADQIDEVDQALNAQPMNSGSLDAEAVATLQTAVEELQITVSTEVASQLGVTLAFSDADGDSG